MAPDGCEKGIFVEAQMPGEGPQPDLPRGPSEVRQIIECDADFTSPPWRNDSVVSHYRCRFLMRFARTNGACHREIRGQWRRVVGHRRVWRRNAFGRNDTGPRFAASDVPTVETAASPNGS